jgi:acyl carrier protein
MDILEKIIDILCDQLDLDREQVTQDSEIIDDLGADSLDIVDLIMTLEDEFNTEITDEMVEGMKTVGDIAKYVEEHC